MKQGRSLGDTNHLRGQIIAGGGQRPATDAPLFGSMNFNFLHQKKKKTKSSFEPYKDMLMIDTRRPIPESEISKKKKDPPPGNLLPVLDDHYSKNSMRSKLVARTGDSFLLSKTRKGSASTTVEYMGY